MVAPNEARLGNWQNMVMFGRTGAKARGGRSPLLKMRPPRILRILNNLRHLPTFLRMGLEMVQAQEDVASGDYLAAERRLLRVYAMAPSDAVERSPANLLMALVALRLGNPAVAADLAPVGVRNVGSLRVTANKAERAYLQYAGRLIFEEATRQLGQPKTINVGVEFDDLDVRRVRLTIRDTYLVHRSHLDEDRKRH